MSSVIRSFIAVDLPTQLQHSIGNVSDNLAADIGGDLVRWVAPHKIHLTLKFLGDVSEANIPRIQEIIQAESAGHKVFEISIGGIGVFPNLTQPRVLWVGVEAPKELLHLQRRIEAEMGRLGYAPDKRKFSPHLTLGRVARGTNSDQMRRISENLRKHKIGFVGATRVTAVHLYKSDLKPTGAVYSKLFSAQLGAN